MPTASDILSRARIVLQDEESVRWTLPELVGWLNDGLRAIVLGKPSASAVSVVLELQAGTLQALTDAAHLQLLRIVRNITSVGPPRVAGRVIRPTPREALDSAAPDWHDNKVIRFKQEVRQYVYDEANPREWYCYPGNDGTGKVEAVVSKMPALVAPTGGDANAIGAYNTAIDLPEPWGVVLLDYVLYRAFSKDDMVGDAGKSNDYLQKFSSAVGIKIQVEGASSPNSGARVSRT